MHKVKPLSKINQEKPQVNACSYIPNSNQPCEKCPRLISMLYMCGFLQEGVANEPIEE